MRDKKSQVLI